MQIIQIGNITEKEKGYLVGLFLGDGHADYNKKDRHYNTEFYLNSKSDLDIQEFLLTIIKKLDAIVHIFKDPRYNVNRIRISSKIFFTFLQNEVASFCDKTLPFSKSFLLGVVSGLIDSEGYVKHGSILITQKDESLLRDVEKICKDFEVRCSLRKQENFSNRFIWRAAVSTRFKYLDHISKKVQREYGPSSSGNLYKRPQKPLYS